MYTDKEKSAMQHPSVISAIRMTLIMLALSVITGCGFQLRGQASLPFRTLYVTAPVGHSIGPETRRIISSGSNTRVTENARDAEARLDIISAANEKSILSLSGGGRVREFQLRYRVSFRLTSNGGEELIATNEIVLNRILPFEDAQVLAKEAEENLLVKEMQNDAIQQILRRMATIRVHNAWLLQPAPHQQPA